MDENQCSGWAVLFQFTISSEKEGCNSFYRIILSERSLQFADHL
jgi:hypothetical protein